MVAIDPANVRTAAAHLRGRAEIASELDVDLRRAGLLSELDTSAMLAACAEIDEELGILARILVSRADEAEGFFLPGNNWRLTSVLLGSLLDDHGAIAEMTAPLALHTLMEQGVPAAIDGSNPTTTRDPVDSLVFTVAGLEALAVDPRSSPELAAAATFLATNPSIVEVTAAWEGTGATLPSHGIDEIPLRDIAAFLERNDVLRSAVGPNGIRVDDIHAEIDDAALVAAGIDPDRFNELAMPRNAEELLIAAVDHGTFNHNPTVARSFVQTLPIDYLDGQSIDIRQTDSAAIERLYDAATLDLGDSPEDFVTRALVVASLPESNSGIRNELITSNYAEIAAWQNELLNDSTLATDPNYRGNNWFHLGTSASDSVSPVIEGSLRVLGDEIWPGFGTPDAVDQDVADGNQAIYHHFMTSLASLWRTGSTKSPRLDTAFALLDEAANTTDTAEAQHLVAESTVLFSIEEQIVVDPYLQLEGLGIVDHVGTSVLTFLTNAGDSRSAAEVMTDEGELSVQADGVDLIPPIVIGEPVAAPAHDNNYLDPELLDARLPDGFDWSQTQANDWTSLAQRMPVIKDVTILTLTEPALPAMVANRARGNLDRD